MFFEERVADLTRKMLRKKFYVVLSKPVVAPDKLQPFLSAHLEYMIGLEKRGHVFASGPLADGAGPPTGAGLTVLRAKDLNEARGLAEGDPFFVNGFAPSSSRNGPSWRARWACGSICPIKRSK